jgi:hypothetical protein
MATEYLEDYELVESRLRRLYTAYPKARIITDMVFNDDRRFIVKAELYLEPDDMTPSATGYAEEIVGAGFVNKTSALENCETSAIGRAISNSVLCLGAPEGKRPSRQEMEKVERYKSEPRKPAPSPRAVPVVTTEQIHDATVLVAKARHIDNLDDLREMWTAAGELLDVKVDGTTLKDTINRKVKELSSGTN